MKILLAFILTLMVASSQSQTAGDTMRYVDFHIHTAFKNYYRSVPHPDSMYSDHFLKGLGGINWSGHSNTRIKDPYGFSGIDGKFAYNQATFDVLNKSHASFLCTSFYSIEKQAAQNTGIPLTIKFKEKLLIYLVYPFVRDARLIASNGFRPKIFNVVADKVMQINKERLALYKSPSFTNFREQQAQVKFIENQVSNPPFNAARPIFFVRDSLQLDSLLGVNFKSPPIFLFATYEGGHNFYGKINADIKNVRTYVCDGECEAEIFKNIRAAKNDNHHLFFVTLAHLFWNKMAGFARGLDVDNKGFRKKLAAAMWDTGFARVDGKDAEGIVDTIKFVKKNIKRIDCNTIYEKDPNDPGKVRSIPGDFGWRVIDSILSKNNKYNRRTYIDLRHMDVMARRDYIDHLKEIYYPKGDTIPIIISHAAVSGKKELFARAMGLSPMFDDYKEFIDPLDFYEEELFSPHYPTIVQCWKDKLGLTPQDIKEHMKSAGWFHPMSANLFDEEIQDVYKYGGIIGITLEERALGKGAYNYKNEPAEAQIGAFFEKNYNTYFGQYSGSKDQLLKDIKDAEPFVRNLFYILEKSGYAGLIKSWEHIAIGSDFDGIMNPIDICPTSADIPKFYSFLLAHLKFYADYLDKRPLLLGFEKDPAPLLNNLFYLNGERFIKKYF